MANNKLNIRSLSSKVDAEVRGAFNDIKTWAKLFSASPSNVEPRDLFITSSIPYLSDVAIVYPGYTGEDDAIAINSAIQRAKKVVLAGTQFHIMTPIIWRSGVSVEGESPMNGSTIIFSSVDGDYSIKVEGTLGIEGPSLTNVALRNFTLMREGSGSTKGIRFAAVANAVVESVKIYGMNGGPSLQLEQVWDSWFGKGYVHSSSYAGPATVIHMGLDDAYNTETQHGDNSNNLRFNGWTWEANQNTEIQFVGGGGANNLYTISFNQCKIERGSTLYDAPLIYVQSGVVINVAWNDCFVLNRTGGKLIDVADTGTYLRYWVFRGGSWSTSYTSAPHAGLMRFYNSGYMVFEWVRFTVWGGSFETAPVIMDTTSNQYNSIGSSINENGGEIFSRPTATPMTWGNDFMVRRKRFDNGVTGYFRIVPYDGLGFTRIVTHDGNIFNIYEGRVGIGGDPDESYKLKVTGTVLASRHAAKASGEVSMFFGEKTDAPSNQKHWDIYQTDDTWQLRMQSDDYTSVSTAIAVYRSGTTVQKVKMGGTLLADQIGLGGTSASIGGTAMVAGECRYANISVVGAKIGDVVAVVPATYPGAGAVWNAYVPEADVVKVVLTATIAMTPIASAYHVRVLS